MAENMGAAWEQATSIVFAIPIYMMLGCTAAACDLLQQAALVLCAQSRRQEASHEPIERGYASLERITDLTEGTRRVRVQR
jgi:hypothetical protein